MGLKYEQAQRIEQLYRELYLPLCIYANSALQSRPLAEEAVQDTFRIACTKAMRTICCAAKTRRAG